MLYVFRSFDPTHGIYSMQGSFPDSEIVRQCRSTIDYDFRLWTGSSNHRRSRYSRVYPSSEGISTAVERSTLAFSHIHLTGTHSW